MQSQLLNTQQAATYLSVSKAFLERDRWAGARVPFIKIGSRAVRYRAEDLDAYIESRVKHSTSE
ncbi:MAG: helix-turn-helix domain-containing protein [Pseudomonadales bacterium]